MPNTPRARRAALRPLALAALLGLPVAGCLRGRLPAREFYRLRALPEALRAASGAPGGGPAVPVTVEAYATPGVYGGPGIVYRVGETRYGTYPTREWAVPLGTMLGALTAERVRRAAGGTGAVVDGPAAAGARGLVWRGTVREFEEVDRGAQVLAAVRLEARLVRAADDSVLWQGAAQVQRRVTPPDAMTAVVDSLAAAAGAAIDELVRAAGPALRAAPASRR